MMNKYIYLFLIASTVFAIQPAWTEKLTADEILRKVDDNYVTQGRVSTTTMIIKGSVGTRELTSKSWVEDKNAFVEYLSPPREEGTKMLKLDDKLWIYSPSSDRTINIAGHLLRQSLMGSDSSYEDFMEDPVLSNSYDTELTGEEEMGGRSCWTLALTVKEGQDVAYHSRKLWVDQERFLPLKQDLYAKSGKLLKTFTINEVFKVEGRWYPKNLNIKDILKEGDGTDIIIESIEFDVDIPEHIFSKSVLRK